MPPTHNPNSNSHFLSLPPELRMIIYTRTLPHVKIDVEIFTSRESKSGRFGYCFIHPDATADFQSGYNNLFNGPTIRPKQRNFKHDCNLLLVCKLVSREFKSSVLKNCVFILPAGPAAMLWTGLVFSQAQSPKTQNPPTRSRRTRRTSSQVNPQSLGHRLIHNLSHIRLIDLAFDIKTWQVTFTDRAKAEMDIITSALRVFSRATHVVVRISNSQPQDRKAEAPPAPSHVTALVDTIKGVGSSLQSFHLSFRYIERTEWLDAPLARAVRVGTEWHVTETWEKEGGEWAERMKNTLWEIEPACEACDGVRQEFEYCDHSMLQNWGKAI